MTATTKTPTRFPPYIWATILLLPLALVVPWVFVLAVPVIALGAIGYLGWRALERTWHEDPPDGPVDVLALRGLQDAPAVEAELRLALDALFADTPDHADPAACACVVADDDHHVGVLRTRTRDGHTYERFFAKTPDEVGLEMSAALRARKASPAEMTLRAEPMGACNGARCPLGRKSVFYIHRDDFGRPRNRLPHGG